MRLLSQKCTKLTCSQSINFTKVPLPPRLPIKSSEPQEEKHEYSSRELKPGALLLRDLLRAHSIFLLHHDTSLSALFVRSKRTKFVAVLSRYWDLFLSTWNVMLHGNPVRNIFGGINIAASGELGVGVGEEERGSGEREVLEGLVGRIEGLVDLVVSKFGSEEADDEPKSLRDRPDAQVWLGAGEEPAAEDGAIFLGTGELSRKSVRDITHWMEDLYQWGDHAYGVIDSPTSTRTRGKKTRKVTKSVDETIKTAKELPASKTADKNDAKQAEQTEAESKGQEQQDQTQSNQEQGQIPTVQVQQPDEQQPQPQEDSTPDPKKDDTSSTAPKEPEDGKLDKMFTYMKLGYGSYWTLPGTGGNTPATQSGTDTPSEAPKPKDTTSPPSRPKLSRRTSSDAHGHYLIGLKGAISEPPTDSDSSSASSILKNNSRTVLRTINVELDSKSSTQHATTIIRDFAHPASPLTQSQVAGNFLPGYTSHDLNKSEKLRVVVYVNRPFIFAFFFKLHTDSLAWDALYRSLHYQLAPLKKPLLSSTTYRPEQEKAASRTIYNLVWDPKQLTIHSTIPNIPESSTSDTWSRVDSVNTHLQLLNIHASTRSRGTDLERTHKTNRGWWIVWTRLLEREQGNKANDEEDVPPSPESEGSSGDEQKQDDQMLVSKEIFLIRRASDHVGFRSISTGEGGGGADGASKLVQGIGVDTRRYVEELLSFL